MLKTFYNLEAINIVNFFSEHYEDTKNLPVKFRWALKKNLVVLEPVVKNFESFKQDLVEELQGEFFTEEKSFEDTLEQTDEFGNIQEVQGRRIKPEFEEEYNNRINEINDKLKEVTMESADYDISVVDLDSFVESLDDDSDVPFEILEMLTFQDLTTNKKEEDI